MQKVIEFTRNGWPSTIPDELQQFSRKRDELSVNNQYLFWGIRVVIPKSLRQSILEELHLSHPGMTRMKTITRGQFWWPGLDSDIEGLAKSCSACLEAKQAPAKAPLHPWTWPSKPWQRIHVDYAGPFMGNNYLLVVDAHSKWGEVIEVSTTTSVKTIETLRQLFARYSLPSQLVSDNGPQFISKEFEQFMKSNGIRHTRSTPYHPASMVKLSIL